MASQLRGSEGRVMYGYRVAATFGAWETTQDPGDPAILVEVENLDLHPLWSTYDPTELRLKVGGVWWVYRQNVELVGDATYRAEGKREVQT